MVVDAKNRHEYKGHVLDFFRRSLHFLIATDYISRGFLGMDLPLDNQLAIRSVLLRT
jgi:hypothetical protein